MYNLLYQQPHNTTIETNLDILTTLNKAIAFWINSAHWLNTTCIQYITAIVSTIQSHGSKWPTWKYPWFNASLTPFKNETKQP